MGILWPHSNSSILNSGGTRAAGAKLYFFESGTLTPRTTYSDAALTTPRTHPVICDAYGRAPAVFLDYDDYRERVQTSGGVTIWDTDGIPNAAPLTDAAVVDATTLLSTGQMVFELIDSTRAGFVRANGRTIGAAASIATERANVDSLALYTYLYNAMSNTICPVSGGRGANAATDFAANKTLTLPDMRAAVPCGLDTMGNSAASLFAASNPIVTGGFTTAGSTLGNNNHVMTIAQAAAHTHPLSAIATSAGSAHTHGLGTLATVTNLDHSHTVNITDPGHTHVINYSVRVDLANGGAQSSAVVINAGQPVVGTSGSNTTGITAASVATGAHTHTFSGALATESAHTHTVTGTTDSTGGGAAHNNLSRAVLGTWYIKL